jgi:hypothetical protein
MFILKPNAPNCDCALFPEESDAGVELDGKDGAQRWYAFLMQGQGAKVCPSSRLPHSSTLNF